MISAGERATPNPSDCRGLLFERCLWCGTASYRRSFCRTCGSAEFTTERSTGVGVVVRLYGPAHRNTVSVTMQEGFNVLCEFTGVSPLMLAVGARVTVVRAVATPEQGLPVMEFERTELIPGTA
ncbi:zinc ribbon domain-containing protein [Streptomyces sp. YKOK-I1]